MKNIERLVKHAIKGQAALRNFSQALQEESRAGAVEPDVGAL